MTTYAPSLRSRRLCTRLHERDAMNNVQWWKWEEHDDQFGGRVETIFSSSILMFSFLLLFSVPSFTQSASCITKWMGWKSHKERDGHTQDLDWMRCWTGEMRNNRKRTQSGTQKPQESSSASLKFHFHWIFLRSYSTQQQFLQDETETNNKIESTRNPSPNSTRLGTKAIHHRLLLKLRCNRSPHKGWPSVCSVLDDLNLKLNLFSFLDWVSKLLRSRIIPPPPPMTKIPTTTTSDERNRFTLNFLIIHRHTKSHNTREMEKCAHKQYQRTRKEFKERNRGSSQRWEKFSVFSHRSIDAPHHQWSISFVG